MQKMSPTSSRISASDLPEADAQSFAPLSAIAIETGQPAPANLPTLPAYLGRCYTEITSALNTRRAYAADWRHYNNWCQRQRLDPALPNVRTIGLYISSCAAGKASLKSYAISTIERRLSAITWYFRQRGLIFDRQDQHITTILADIRRGEVNSSLIGY